MERTNSPASVAKLEADLRAAQDALKIANEKIADLQTDLYRSDELRGAFVGSVASASRDMVSALTRLEIYQPIVDAAIDWEEAQVGFWSDTDRKLAAAVRVELERRSKQS